MGLRYADPSFWASRTVWISGHTGFKGSWLVFLLSCLGAKCHGYSLEPPTEPSLYDLARVSGRLVSDTRGDVKDAARVRISMQASRPAVVFHLAAQPLVRSGYSHPLETYDTNVMGTAAVLDAVRSVEHVQAVVVVTTDKVYHNQEWAWPYRETDELGGHDPYSASKACAEIITASYRDSFFAHHNPAICSARGGNVIGGGDWAEDRLIPDCVRSFVQGRPVVLRKPDAVRPWQHVLDCLHGYLLLAESAVRGEGVVNVNFGPDPSEFLTVGEVVSRFALLWGKDARYEIEGETSGPHEAALLKLDTSLARSALGWVPIWQIDDALKATAAWYRSWECSENMSCITETQVMKFLARESNV